LTSSTTSRAIPADTLAHSKRQKEGCKR
jgi:hypothetical protein